MELKTYLSILIRRWRLVLLVVLIVSGLFAYGSEYLPPSYQAETRLRVITPLAGSMRDAYHEVYFASRLITTYAQIATSDQIMSELQEDLNLEKLPEISVKIIPDSEIIQIVVVSADRDLSAKAANALAELIISKQDKVLDTSAISEGVDLMAKQKNELQAKLAEANKEYDELVLISSQTTAQIETLDRKIRTKEELYRELAVQQRQAEMNALADEMASYNQQYEKLSTDSSIYTQQIVMLRQEIENDQRIYADLLYNNIRPERTQDILVISPAIVPSIPNSPGRWFFVGLGVICGLIAGVVVAFVFDSLDTRIFTFEQIEQITTVPTLGQFPKLQERKNKAGLNLGTAALYRDYWMVCTRIQAILQGGSGKTILVTSPNPTEGKSTFISNIAMGLARNNNKVLIVDFDLRRPQQQKIFPVTGELGLSNFLKGENVRFDDIVQKNVVPDVDLIPNLDAYEDPTELLNSPQFGVLLQKIKKYNVILFDSPALIAGPDAYNLSKVMDGVIILAQWGHTTTDDLQSTCSYLENIGAKLLGIVLSQVPMKKEQSYSKSRETKGWLGLISRIKKIITTSIY